MAKGQDQHSSEQWHKWMPQKERSPYDEWSNMGVDYRPEAVERKPDAYESLANWMKNLIRARAHQYKEILCSIGVLFVF